MKMRQNRDLRVYNGMMMEETEILAIKELGSKLVR